ncbi:MAG: phasin family protein [Parvularculaceae bacterium]
MAATKKTTTETGFDAFSAMNPESFKEGYERAAKGMTAFADFQKESLEAVMASAGVCARGIEKAAAEQSAFMKEAYEESVAASKAASTAKSVQEALEVQTEFARTAFEKNLGFATKLAEHWTSVAKEAADPMSKRYGEFVEMVQSYRP